jgi:tetratricopeptide (TPR) repeat protein
VRPPDGDAPFALAIWHYARGTALARSGRLDEAERERRTLESRADAPALAAVRVKAVHPATALATIARLTLRADLAQARGRTSEALPLLAEAVAIEDALERDEPHLWLAPTRHALGAVLLRAAQPAAAAQVFEQDLRHYPDNGWSLLGLQQAQQALGQAQAAHRTAARRVAAWRDADVTLDAARL